nr:type II toxin-antitoxin system VapC family toxin [uncultured Dyadobacter sp.]
MIYFDTDVLVHFLIAQDFDKHTKANGMITAALSAGTFSISLLSIQELTYVLHRLGQKQIDIEAVTSTFLKHNPAVYDISDMYRALGLCKYVGFGNINDCLHTAIAERSCDTLCTFNKSDFRKIAKHAGIRLQILS